MTVMLMIKNHMRPIGPSWNMLSLTLIIPQGDVVSGFNPSHLKSIKSYARYDVDPSHDGK